MYPGQWILGNDTASVISGLPCVKLRETQERSGRFVTSLFFFFVSSRATPSTYGGSQARGLIGATSATYTTAHNNAGSLTHWVRPGIEPSTSWFLVGFVSAAPRRELLNSLIYQILCFLFAHIFVSFKTEGLPCGSQHNDLVLLLQWLWLDLWLGKFHMLQVWPLVKIK